MQQAQRIHTYQRVYIYLVGLVGTLLLLRSSAAAQSDNYAVTFEEVTSNCDKQAGLTFKRATLQLTRQGENVQVQVPAQPVLRGSVRKGNKLKAEAETTDTSGVRRRLSASGRADNKQVQLLFIAEFYRGDTSLCTQSWNVMGARQDSGSRATASGLASADPSSL